MSYWAKTYGPGEAKAVAVDRNGDIIVVGERKGDAFVARLDKDGKVKWFKTYGGSRKSSFGDVKIAPNGDIIVAGYFNGHREDIDNDGYDEWVSDLWVLRLDENGNVKWQKTYGRKYWDEANAVALADNGDIIVAGYTRSFGAGSADVWVLRLDGNGNVKWQKTYGGSYEDRANAVALADNGDIIVAGYTYSFYEGAWVLRLDGNGNVKWQKTYWGSSRGEANAVAVADNGDVIVAGWTWSFGAGKEDVWVLRLDGNGNIKWQKTYGGSDEDEATAVAIASNGDVIVAGYTKSFGAGSLDVWVLRLDENGNVKWQKTYGGGDGGEKALAVALTPNDDIIVAGWTWNFGGIWVLRLPPNGNLPGCDFCGDSNAQVSDSDAYVDDTKCEVLSGIRKYKVEVEEGRIFKKKRKEWRTERVSVEVKDSEAKVETKRTKPETQYLLDIDVDKVKRQLSSALTVALPVLREGVDSTLKLALTNSLADSLKAVFDLSENEFLRVEAPTLESEELKRGEKATGTIKVTPIKAGNFNLKIKIKTTIHGLNIETEKVVPVKVEKLNLEEILHVAVPQLVESIEAPLKLTITNNLADSLKATLDLSGNDFFDLETTTLEFPELRKGQKVSKSITVTPKYAGAFDLRIGIKAIVNGLEIEAEKTIPVEVAEKTATPAYATPQTPVTPATPQTPAYTPTPATPAPTPSPAGLQLPADFPAQLAYKYTEVEPIGRGGFARVFKAKRKDGKVVAVKIPLSLDENTGKAFLREISHWLQLKHPNIVKLYDANILPIPFLEMEYCESSLEKLPKPLPVEVASYIVFNIAEGLKYAHSKGIIHRDLKPSNVLLKEGIPKISDWGLSKAMAETHSTTMASFTPFYASPEQTSRRFGKPDHRSDIWQLGVIFYQLVTGRLPFEGDDLIEVVSRIATEEPVPPSELNPEAKEIEHVILTCLEKNPDDRYQSVAELQLELATYLGLRYKKELKRSITVNDTPRAAFYAGKLMLMFLKMGNMKEAYKYASDLEFYASGELSRDVEELAEGIKVRLEEGLSFAGEELLAKAEIIAHKVSLGFEKL